MRRRPRGMRNSLGCFLTAVQDPRTQEERGWGSLHFALSQGHVESRTTMAVDRISAMVADVSRYKR